MEPNSLKSNMEVLMHYVLLLLGLSFTGQLSADAPQKIYGEYCGPHGAWFSVLIPDYWGSAKFYRACKQHDICYNTCGSERDQCDQSFHSLLRAECAIAYDGSVWKRLCNEGANSYYSAVYRNGRDYFELSQETACSK